ncbi:FA43A protein, partial [Sylvietta virens]|nr:FA43A protein [Sylvietta virens]
MLPWKRSKVELAAGEARRQSKPKGYAVFLHYSALTSLARACPFFALHRVGSMFRSKRFFFRVTSEDPTYTVLFFFNATTIQSKGEGCTFFAVCKIWSKSEAGRFFSKMKLTISAQGIRIFFAEDKGLRRPGHLYFFHRVTYCVADPRLPFFFAWIYRHELKHKAVMLRCHAVLVSKPEKAFFMALLLYQTSATALFFFRRLKKRDDARHQLFLLVGEQSIPLVPLRFFLNGQCCYKPPVERFFCAPKLGSITEDLLVFLQEERAMHCDCEDIFFALGEPEGELLRPSFFCGESPELGQLLRDLFLLSLGNDLRSLRADFFVRRLLSGESTGSEFFLESGGTDGAAPPGIFFEQPPPGDPETG